jgi:hypothetical protein
VCAVHGGSTPQVRRKAAQRLAAARTERRMQRVAGRGLNALEYSWLTGDKRALNAQLRILLAEVKEGQ